MKTLLYLFFVLVSINIFAQNVGLTHGPILGHVTDSSIRVWVRTSQECKVKVQAQAANQIVVAEIQTFLKDDFTGFTAIEGLLPDTRYILRCFVDGKLQKDTASIKTLPNSKILKDEKWNPKGLFNFSFEFGSCANQNPRNGIGPSLPTYTTMNNVLLGKVDFAIMNGDWVYEEKRDFPLEEWAKKSNISAKNLPKKLQNAPTLVGTWENYKLYLDRAPNLARWHRNMPSYFTFDDHELLNDIWGAGTAGRRDRRAVFRDIGTAGWYNYLGWANPTVHQDSVIIGRTKLVKGSKILHDPEANFTKLNWEAYSNLHVHWGTTTAGVDQLALDADSLGDPNSRVYSIERVIDKTHLELSHEFVANTTSSYSIGRSSYGKFDVGNCTFYLLDTKSYREMHDTGNRAKEGLSILGKKQYEWLIKSMQESKADFHFVISSVPFMIPHIGAGGYEMADNKDESWTVFIDEREKLINFWDKLGKKVFVLTGDLHNSFAIKVSENVWEFCSGPHNSINHARSDEGMRPATGLFTFDKREMDIRWSSIIQGDVPRSERLYPYYCVVKVNNVYNNPLKLGETRWIAYEHPQVIFQYFDGRTGEFRYSETISTPRK